MSSADLAMVPLENVTGGNSAAPLGTNPLYEVELGGAIVTPVDTSHSSSKAASSLAPGQLFKLNRITLAPKGQVPNLSSTSFIFNEGDTVDFFAEYEAAANVQFTRKWTMDSCGLEYAEPPTAHAQTGTYLAMFRYTLPYGSADENAAFNFEAFYGTRTTSSRHGSAAHQCEGDDCSSKGTSVVIGGGDPPNFNIIDLTMMHDGEPVDWTLSHQQYIEGQEADLWIKFEMLANSMNINRHWLAPAIDLDQTEFAIPTVKGIYEIKLDWHIPTGAVVNNAVFQYDLTNGTIHKYSEPFYFDVVAGGGAGSVYNSTTSIVNFTGTDLGIWCGHIDVDTAHLVYPDNNGSTNGHVHEWDDKFNSRSVNYFNLRTTSLRNIQTQITDPNQKFKIIVANANLSPGTRIVINQVYNENDPSTYSLATLYDDIPVANLPVYSLGGAPGSIKLTSFSTEYLTSAIHDRQVHPTNTGDVRGNELGPNGEARNGALIIQAVKVNADGSHGFTTNPARSNGGVHGVAASGLLYESTTFWHWDGPSYHETGWSTYDPSDELTCDDNGSQGTTPSVLASGGGTFRILEDTSLTKTYYPGSSGVSDVNFPTARMCWEDLQNSGDFDYNEFVGDVQATEWRTPAGGLKQIKLYIKARARGASDNTKAWQFNIDGSFPGGSAHAKVDQYYDNADADLNNDQTHKFQSFWNSTNGINVPVFVSTRDALPLPSNSNATTNTVKDTNYVEGDYAIVTITFDNPVAAGTYTPAPYNPELRVQQGTNAAYVYHLWRKQGDPLLSNGFPLGGFILPGNFPWMMETKAINTSYPAWDKWVKWISCAPMPGPGTDPNTYLLNSGAPAIGGSILGSPMTIATLIGSAGQTDFHTPSSGQLSVIDLVKYLNGDTSLTNQSISQEALKPMMATQAYYTKLPFRLSKPTSNPCDGYADYKGYLQNGASTSKPLDFQLGARLAAVVVNVERGWLKPNEWVWIPELNEIRPLAADAVMPNRAGVIREANLAWQLPSNTANNAVKQRWITVLDRVLANSFIVQQQPWPEPSPRWYEAAPVGTNHYQRSLFKP